MLGSITPLGEWGRDQRWWLTTSFYILGSALGGASLGTVLGGVGSSMTLELPLFGASTPLVVLAAAIILGLTLDLRLAGLELPTIRRQVRQDWLTDYRGWVYGFGFGFQLGLGVVTVVSTSVIYTTFIACFLSGSPTNGALIGATFGMLRASTLFSISRVRRPEQLERVDPTLKRFEPGTRYAAYAVNAVLVTVIATSVVAGVQ